MADHSEDGNSMFTTSNKKIQLTEADYAGVPGMENGREVTGIENPAASGEKEPEMVDERPGARSAEVQVAPPPAPQSRAGMAMVLGLLGVIGASGALWMNLTLSDRMGQLETQASNGREAATISSQNKEITLLNQRVDTLETTVSSRMAATSKPVPAVTVQTSSSDLPAIAAPPVKPVIADVKTPSENHQGAWVVNLTSLSHATAASHELSRLKRLGIHAESAKAEIQGKTWYRIRVPGFASAEEANRQRKKLATRLNIHGTWVGKR